MNSGLKARDFVMYGQQDCFCIKILPIKILFFHLRRAREARDRETLSALREKQKALPRQCGALPGGGEVALTFTYQDQELTHEIIGTAIQVHKHLGPGLLETAYRWCLEIEFKEKGWVYQREQAVPLVYKNKKLDCGFRFDFLVENKIVLELKSVEQLLPIHEAQLLTYLRLLDKHVGLLINFNEPILKKRIRRCVLGAKDSLSSSGQGPALAR